MQNFDDLALAVASFGSTNKVIFDDIGLPSIMVGVPKMKYSDVITDGTQEVSPWWVVDGVEKGSYLGFQVSGTLSSMTGHIHCPW